MFQRLREKWKVNTIQLILVISTFAIGGSLTGYVSRRLLQLFHIGPYWLWLIVFIIVLTLLWPLAVLAVSIPLGQYSFFIKYIRKIGSRFGIGRSLKSRISIAIFASGSGSNAQKIIDKFRNHTHIKVALIVTNNSEAGIVKIAKSEKIELILLKKDQFFGQKGYLDEIRHHKIDWIILAGFLWKIPVSLLKAFRQRIINIHPALLPKYGGKGMYGHHVHEAVILNREVESGISIHFVDELYDHGPVIFQARCPVLPNDTAETLAQRIHFLEYEHYPQQIEKIISKN